MPYAIAGFFENVAEQAENSRSIEALARVELQSSFVARRKREPGVCRARCARITTISLDARRSSAADAQNIGLLAASANAPDYAVDVGVILIKDLPRIRLGNIGCDWLVVTYGR